jgi:hypothetical protein
MNMMLILKNVVIDPDVDLRRDFEFSGLVDDKEKLLAMMLLA